MSLLIGQSSCSSIAKAFDNEARIQNGKYSPYSALHFYYRLFLLWKYCYYMKIYSKINEYTRIELGYLWKRSRKNMDVSLYVRDVHEHRATERQNDNIFSYKSNLTISNKLYRFCVIKNLNFCTLKYLVTSWTSIRNWTGWDPFAPVELKHFLPYYCCLKPQTSLRVFFLFFYFINAIDTRSPQARLTQLHSSVPFSLLPTSKAMTLQQQEAAAGWACRFTDRSGKRQQRVTWLTRSTPPPPHVIPAARFRLHPRGCT